MDDALPPVQTDGNPHPTGGPEENTEPICMYSVFSYVT
jgi:hypothetical protein